MKLRKILAVALAAAMVVGSSSVGFAAGEVTSAGTTGSGTVTRATGKDVTTVVLPTTPSDGIFNYKVDPEGLIAASGKIFTGNSAGTATFNTSDGVYFTNSAGVYSNTSNKVKLVVQSYNDADVTVSAKVTSAGTLPLVASQAALDSAGTASLLLTMNVTSSGGTTTTSGGTTTGSDAITTSGGTVKVQVKGAPTLFTLDAGDSADVYKYTPSDGTASGWGYAEVYLTGATTQGKEVPSSGLVAPTVDFTWTVAPRSNGPKVTLTTAGKITMSGLTSSKNYDHSAVLAYGSSSDELDTDPNLTWDTSSWSATDGGTLIFDLSAAWLSALSGKSATVTVKLTDGSTISATTQF